MAIGLLGTLTRAVSPALASLGRSAVGSLGRLLGIGTSVIPQPITTVARTVGRTAGRILTSPTARTIGTIGAGTIAGELVVRGFTSDGQPIYGSRKRRRRMNVLNMHALDRSIRRVEGFNKRIRKVTRLVGSKPRKVKFGGRRKRG